MTWTIERVEILKKLWADGCSAAQIAAELGDTSRNSVIGKVHRLGLPGRVTPPAPPPRPRKPKHQPGRVAVAIFGRSPPLKPSAPVPFVPAPPVVPDESTRCSIMDLTSTTCRWIVGDAHRPLDAIFCGGKPSARVWGKFGRGTCPYCDAHADRAA
jgi:GcrA cell cycle regulator